MSKVNNSFNTFLSNIEPSVEAVEYAQEAHKPVRAFLETNEDFGKNVTNTFLYGSYRRHTAVGDIKDIDIVVLTNFDTTDENNTPQKVLRQLKAALARHYNDPENPEYQRRSIRIKDPLPQHPDVLMTLDIIPAVAPDGEDEPLLVPDREVKQWISSHPKGHLKAMTYLNRDEYGAGRFIPLVKIMKSWWKYQCEERQPDVERPKPKGFWVECLTSENFDPKQTYWADHFIATLTSISTRYRDAKEVPQLRDPGLARKTIKTNMTLDEFKVFMTAVDECLALAITARDHGDDVESSVIWRDILGEKFPLFEEDSEEKRIQAAALRLGVTPRIEPLRWPNQFGKTSNVRIDAYVYQGDVRLRGLNTEGTALSPGQYIQFIAKPKIKGPYEVWWQVVNTGQHAKEQGGLRGELFKARYKNFVPSVDPLINWEHVQYHGKHWIQCFIIQNEKCVAMSPKFYVRVRNPGYQL